MSRKKPSFDERIALAEARAAEELARLEGRPVAPPQGGAVGARFEAATRRLIEQIQRLRRDGRAPGARPLTVTELHDLEPAVRLLDELERERVSRREDLENETRTAAEWEHRAMRAVHARDDGLAREALAHRRDCLARATSARQDLEIIESSLAMLRPIIDSLRGVPE